MWPPSAFVYVNETKPLISPREGDVAFVSVSPTEVDVVYVSVSLRAKPLFFVFCFF